MSRVQRITGINELELKVAAFPRFRLLRATIKDCPYINDGSKGQSLVVALLMGGAIHI